MTKKRFLLPLSALFAVSLSACVRNPALSSTGDSSFPASSLESSSSLSDPFEPTPLSLSKNSYRIELRTTTLREGTNFFDGTGFELYKAGTLMKSYPKCVLTKDEKEFDPYSPLEAGTYSFVASILNPTTRETTTLEGSVTVKKSETVLASEGLGYHTIGEEDSLKYRVGNFDNHGALGPGKTNSIGSPKILVLPLTFTDTSYSEKELSLIEKSYFGETKETGWESLKSYYEKSSYGKLSFKGEVTSAYEYPMSSKEVEDAFLDGKLDTNMIVNKAVADVLARDGLSAKDYDVDGDGYLDGVEVIYKTTGSFKNNSALKNLWWCFTTYTGTEPNKEKPVLNRYFWSLYSKVETDYYGGLADAHTIVHETGHMLGLNDYYDYTNKSCPAGLVDMMDLNVGDHGAYSKYLLGWVTPKVIDGSASDFTITLNSFTDTGDCILLRNTTDSPHNGTPYDEYLMLSYVTPTGVNEIDSKGYPEWEGYGRGATYQKAGLSLSHVDERMISLEGSQLDVDGGINLNRAKASYTRTPSNEMVAEEDENGKVILTKSPTFTLSSNSTGYSQIVNVLGKLGYSSTVRENTLIPADGSDAFLTSINDGVERFGEQRNLFGLDSFGGGGTFFGLSKYSSLFPKAMTFNDETNLNYVFSVESQTDTTITLRFIKNF